MRRSNRARYKLASYYKLESNAAMRAASSRKHQLCKGFFKELFIGIKPA